MLYALMSRLENWFDHLYCISPSGSIRERVFGWLYCHTNPVRPKAKDPKRTLSLFVIAYHVTRGLLSWVRGERIRSVIFIIYGEDHHTSIVEGNGLSLAHSIVAMAEGNDAMTEVVQHAAIDLCLVQHADPSGHVDNPLAALLGGEFPSFLMSAMSDDDERDTDD